MESAKTTIKAAQAIQDISKIINMERQDISPAAYSFYFKILSPQLLQYFCREKLFHNEKTVGQFQKFKVENVQHYI